MSGSKARAAVIGLGPHGFRHLQAYQLVDNLDLMAVCDIRADQVAAALDQYPGVNGYTDWQQLLNEEKIDLVSVVTNGPSHAAITIAAANHGVKQVLCEKPMATSVKDAQEMIQVCKNQSTRLAVCHSRRWFKGYQELRDLIDQGIIGKLSHFWFTCGGGLFAGNGMHIMDLARMLSSAEPKSVVAVIDESGTPNPRGHQFKDPGVLALYSFDNDMRLVMDMFEDLGVPPRIEIVGSIGRILIDEADLRWEIVSRQAEDRDKPVLHYWLPLVGTPFKAVELDMIEMLTSALEELLGEGPIRCTGEDGLASLEMFVGAHASGQNASTPIPLPLPPDFWQIDLPVT